MKRGLKTNLTIVTALAAWGSFTALAGEYDVSVSPIKIVGQKALVKMEMVNHLAEPVAAVKAVCFVNDDAGHVVAQTTRWVFGGGTTNTAVIPVGATNFFHFVVNSPKPWTTTNLTAKLVFSRVVLKSGQLADPVKDVKISSTAK